MSAKMMYRSVCRLTPPTSSLVTSRHAFRASFHSTSRHYVEAGDSIPDLEVLTENSPGNKVNLAKELSSGKSLVIGVPAAFSPSCSNSHIPGYISHSSLSNYDKVFVVSVNDPFVMKAWATTLDPQGKSGIRFLADPSGAFTKALGDVTLEAATIFGNDRSKRYALKVEDGKVTSVHIEPDGTGVDVSSAAKVLG